MTKDNYKSNNKRSALKRSMPKSEFKATTIEVDREKGLETKPKRARINNKKSIPKSEFKATTIEVDKGKDNEFDKYIFSLKMDPKSKLFVKSIKSKKNQSLDNYIEPSDELETDLTDYETDTEESNDNTTFKQRVLRIRRNKYGNNNFIKNQSQGSRSFAGVVAELQSDWLVGRWAQSIDGKYTPVRIVNIDTTLAKNLYKKYLELTNGKLKIKILQRPDIDNTRLNEFRKNSVIVVPTYGGSQNFIDMINQDSFEWCSRRDKHYVFILVPECDKELYLEDSYENDRKTKISKNYGLASWEISNNNDQVKVSGFGATRRAGQFLAESFSISSISEQCDGDVWNVIKNIDDTFDNTKDSLEEREREQMDNAIEVISQLTPYHARGLGSGERWSIDKEYVIDHEGKRKNPKIKFKDGGRPIEQYVMINNELHYLRSFVTGGEDRDLSKLVDNKHGKLKDFLITKTSIPSQPSAYTVQLNDFLKYLYDQMHKGVKIKLRYANEGYNSMVNYIGDIDNFKKLIESDTSLTNDIDEYEKSLKIEKDLSLTEEKILLMKEEYIKTKLEQFISSNLIPEIELTKYCEYLEGHPRNKHSTKNSDVEKAKDSHSFTPVRTKEWFFCRILELITDQKGLNYDSMTLSTK